MSDRLTEYDYELPDAQIARVPLAERDASRLLHLPKTQGAPAHQWIRDLPQLLRPHDLLVFNDTRVIPARLFGHKKQSGGRVELLLIEPRRGSDGQLDGVWTCLGQASKGLRAGQELVFSDDLWGRVEARDAEGVLSVWLSRSGEALLDVLWQHGHMPLPSYIDPDTRPAAEDPHAARYQTVLARVPGAAAAPTAGLHFTPELLERLESAGIPHTTVTLHVGPGTFLPVRSDDVTQHRMHSERFDVSADTVEAVRRARAAGGRVIAVGTTSLRALEAASTDDGLQVCTGSTDLFVRPGYRFRTVDGLITNFHLPRSTLLMLVCALAGRERILDAYRTAVHAGYRFFSYGDAMLIE